MKMLWILLLAACVPRATTPVITLPFDPNVRGVTVCDTDGKPVIVMNQVHNDNGYRFTLAHEQRHVMQVQAYKGGCHAFMRQYSTDSIFRLKAEAEAMCAEADAGSLEGRDFNAAYLWIQDVLKRDYKGDVTKLIPCKPSG